ncbi:hypothetical protein KKA72_01170 [Patescibacteria group bacterium]|nr:hypothetical protein [Patescibacteria group bacterium]MBU1876942.1 hypothetical protein [Patescibacteria group bacterium]
MKETKVGISQIGVAIPRHFIRTQVIAEKRGISPTFPTKGLGAIEARIPYDVSLEDLSVQALKQIEYSDVRRIFFATESDSDMSKPMAVKILAALGLNVVPPQLKFACLAGLEALILACEYSIATGKPAIVIAVDRSIYSDPEAEVTQGCAAVAIRVEINPKLLDLNYKHYGQYAENINDFEVPLRTAPFPEVYGDLTKPAFLKCLRLALVDWKINNPEFGPIKDRIDYFAVHTPFTKMVEWYMAMFWRHEEHGQEKHITIEDCVKNPKLFSEYKKKIDETRKLDTRFRDFFEKKVQPGLKYNPYVGNPYTVAIFIGLIAILEQAKKGQEIGILGYGSGAGSLVIGGLVKAKNGFKSNLQEQIDQGQELTFEEYEDWRKRTLKKMRQ